MRPFEAQDAVEAAALRAIHARNYSRPDNPWAAAGQEHADEQVALAARDLVRAVDALPEDERPVGWDTAAVAA